MIRSLVKAAAELLLLCAVAGRAPAQSIRSQMGAQAHATISISASVRPVFAVSSAASLVNVSSNAAPALRYSIVVAPTGSAAAEEIRGIKDTDPIGSGRHSPPDPSTERLVLIVPD